MKDYSQFGEQAMVAALLANQKEGTYIDIGAHDGIECSNTRFLWEAGWKGVMVEPTPKRFFKMAENYPERIVPLQYAVSDHNGEVLFHDCVNDIDGRSSFDIVPGLETSDIYVKVLTWNNLLSEIKKNNPEFKEADVKVLSIDTEGQDLLILKQINFAVVRPLVVVIEESGQFKGIDEVLTQAGYELKYRTMANLIYALSYISNKDKWNFIYDSTDQVISYGDEVTYSKGAAFLSDCAQIEDRGCGFGYFSKFVPAEIYIGIDGSNSKVATIKADLAEYKSSVEGIFMRHILEHNHDWEKVLDCAITSFTKKMVLVIFTPFAEETKEIAWNPLHKVPDISFKLEDLTDRFKHLHFELEADLQTGSQYGVENIFYITK
jgi:FkbM family methyltransferase